MTDVKQFKLTNNDEIVCEIAAWNDEETDEMKDLETLLGEKRTEYENLGGTYD